MKSTILIDGHNIAFRSFYGIGKLKRSDGFPTNAIHGWYKTLYKIIDQEKPNQCIVVFDAGDDRARLAIEPEYKKNRTEMPEDLQLQMPWIQKLSSAMGINVVEKKGVEADDILAHYASKYAKSGPVLILSADKDFVQIISASIHQLVPPPTANPRLGWRRLDINAVTEKYGIKPSQMVDYLSLIGDSVDNIPGIPGIGPKTATRWLQQFPSIDDILKNITMIEPIRFRKIIPNWTNRLQKNKKLISFKSELEEPDLAPIPANEEAIRDILLTMEMNQTLKSRENQLNFSF